MSKDTHTTFPKQVSMILGALAVILIALKFVALSNDPPLYFVKHGQSLLTDPYHLTYHARQHTLFGDSNLFGIHRWDNFKNSLISGVAYLTFATGGVSRVTANLAAVLLSVGGILLFTLGIYRRRGQKEALLTLILLSVNHLLFFYGRYPFLENGLIFLSGALFYTYLVYGKTVSGQIVCGALIALAALAGKLFGALLFAPLALTMLYEYRKQALLPLLYALAGAILGGGLYALVFYGGDMSQVLSYYHEQTTGMYGAPPGFAGPLPFIKMLFTYGGESGFIQYEPLYIALGGLALIVVTITASSKLKYDSRFTPIIFCSTWLLVGLAGLSPFYYRPLRYALFLILPAGALISYLMVIFLAPRTRLQLFHRWIAPVVVFIVLWYLLTQVAMYFSADNGRFAAGVNALPTAGVVSGVITLLFGWFFNRPRNFRPLLLAWIALGLPLTILALNHISHIYTGLSKPGTLLQTYNKDISEIISKDAVLTGPYAAALTIDNSVKSIIYMFGLSNIQRNLLQDYPVTHIAVDPSNWQAALKDFPQLNQARLITELVVRDQAVRLYRIAGQSFPQTEFEQATRFLKTGQLDSAKTHFERFSSAHPKNLFGRLGMIVTDLALTDSLAASTHLEQLLADYPHNYFALANALGMYQRLAGLTRSQKHLLTAEALKQRVANLNPYMPTGRVTRVGR